MRFQFKMQLLITAVCFLFYFSTIKCDCLIKFNNKDEVAPKFEKTFGRFKMRVPSQKSAEIGYVKLQSGESVIGSCETYFSPFTCVLETIGYYDYKRKFHNKLISNRTTIVLNCIDEMIFFEKQGLASETLSCAKKNWSIYTTNQPYSWCQKNANTFLFATQFLNGESDILAAFCYNMEHLSLETFVYNTTDLHHYNINQQSRDVNASGILDENLWNFKTITVSQLTNSELQEALSEMAKTDEWLNLANYEVSLIAQNDLLAKTLQGYEAIFNVIWWRPLRVGNWKRFQHTLTKYAQNNSYELYVGTSGVAQYPSDSKCYKEKNAELNLALQNETVPAYIWTFLKSNDHSNKDFVIVGYNSPYAEYFTLEKVIFCPDICMEIAWLRETSATFRYAYAGIMFCCSTDFIRQTHYLHGFPMDLLQQQVTTNATSTATATDEPEFFAEVTSELLKT